MSSTGWIYDCVADFFLRSGAFSNLYWIVIASLFLWLNYMAIGKKHRSESWANNPTLVLLLNCLFFLLLRLPTLLANEIDADESEWIAGAATLIKDPRFWLSVDGTTSGPLNIFPLIVPHILGWEISFSSVRLFMILFIEIPTVCLLYLSIKKLTNTKAGQRFVFLWIFFNAFMFVPSFYRPDGFFNFVYGSLFIYQSEKVPVLFISAIIFLMAQWYRSGKKDMFLLYASFFIIGMLPYAKIQSLYIAFYLGILMVGLLWFCSGLNTAKKATHTLAMGTAVAAPSLICLYYLLCSKAWEDFFQSYILNNIVYSGTTNQSKIIVNLFFDKYIYNPFARTIIKALPMPQLLFLYALLICTAFLLYKFIRDKARLDKAKFFELSTVVAWLLTSYLTVVKSHRPFLHYYSFLLPPLMMTLVVLYHHLVSTGSVAMQAWNKKVKLEQVIAYSLLLFSLPYFISGNKFIDELKHEGKRKICPINKDILTFKKADADKLVVYGWHNNEWGSHNKYYVETSLLQGTRESHSERQMSANNFSGKQFRYYRNRYISDIVNNKPVFILDMESEGYKDFPEFKTILDTKYMKYRSYHLDKFEKDSTSLYIMKERATGTL